MFGFMLYGVWVDFEPGWCGVLCDLGFLNSGVGGFVVLLCLCVCGWFAVLLISLF